MDSPFPKSHTYCPSPCLFGAVSQSCLSCRLPGSTPHIVPNTTSLAILMLCVFLVDKGKARVLTLRNLGFILWVLSLAVALDSHLLSDPRASLVDSIRFPAIS